jgi:hypothetical protein
MRRLLAILLFPLLTLGGLAQVFPLREYGKLEFYPVGEWKFGSEDMGDLKIVIAPKQSRNNAIATLTVAAGGADEYPTEEKLMQQLSKVALRLAVSGEFAERKVTLKTIYCAQGFGFYFIFSDAKLVGRPVIPGDYKNICLGMIRVNVNVMVRLQILSDGEETEAFQQLLGMVEGMELHAK